MSKARVLIVEDERIIALDIRNSLETLGYVIAGQADRGEDAVKKAGELYPDLILMDIGLKGEMDGIQAAGQIRTQFDLPVIFLTSYSDQATFERARVTEPFGYLIKPFEERELVSTIEMALYKHTMEKKLRESEYKFRSVIEYASDGIALIDSQGNIIEWNPAIEKITGFEHSDMIGQPIWEAIFQTIPQEKRTSEFREANAKHWIVEITSNFANKGHIAEYEIESRQGIRRIVESNSFTIETAQGTLGGVIMRDVTGRKQAEQTLRENEERLHVITENAPSIIVEVDKQGTILYMSRVLPGYHMEDIIGKNVADWISPEYKPSMQQAFELVLKEGTAQSYESYAAGANGEMRWYLTSLAPTKIHDQIKSVILVSTDITEHKTAEIERGTLLSQLKTKNLELEQFTYTVSHDLKAPLVSISGFLGYLEKDFQTGNLERVKSDVHRITDAVVKMQRLLNELLELSRIGRVMNPPQFIAFESIVQDALELVAGHIAKSKAQVEIAPDMPSIYCDRTRITQVLQNLIENAIKFTGDQPEPHIWIGQRALTHEVIFFVRDNGIGIAPQHQDRIFGLFDKLNSNIEGTGLGLTLVKRIIETHGGKIWVESEGTGKGSTFCFTIPDGRKVEQ